MRAGLYAAALSRVGSEIVKVGAKQVWSGRERDPQMDVARISGQCRICRCDQCGVDDLRLLAGELFCDPGE